MKKIFALVFLMSNAFCAQAEVISAIPTSWQVESYGSQGVVLWFTPAAPCNSGQLILPNTATLADHNRLYATIMAGKSANLKVFVWYTVSAQQCIITSYGFAQE